MCCSFTNYSDPISLGTIVCLSFVLGTLVMLWMLVSLMKKKWRTSDYCRWAMMLWQTHIYYITPLHPGNKYQSPHACYLVSNHGVILGISFGDTCLPLSKHLNYLLLLVILVMSLRCFGWSCSIYNVINMSHWPCYKANVSLVYCITSPWISCSYSLVSILCVHVSWWINIFVMLST